MGISLSQAAYADAAKRNEDIEILLRKEKRNQGRLVRLLLLGAGGCGKSTLLKQMRLIHGGGFDHQEVEVNRVVIRSNIVEQMVLILAAMRRSPALIQFADPKLDAASAQILEEVGQQELDGSLPGATVEALRMLWATPAVKAMAKHGSEFHLNESASYFFDNLERVMDPDYVPTQQDIIMNRISTLGIVQVKICIKGLEFRVFDVGGQRSQRRKWIHCFDNVTAVIFMMALSEFDEQIDEDDSTNRLSESLMLFDSICNSSFFVRASMILFLNKRDIFLAKIAEGKSIKSIFPCYRGATGPNSHEEQAEYIAKKFLERKKDNKKIVYAHQVCATDTNQVQIVLDNALETMIFKNLNSSGVV